MHVPEFSGPQAISIAFMRTPYLLFIDPEWLRRIRSLPAFFSTRSAKAGYSRSSLGGSGSQKEAMNPTR
jgi:hypothetical protein